MPMKHQCRAAFLCDDEAGMLWAPKSAAAMQNNVAAPKSTVTPMWSSLKKGLDDKAGMPWASKRAMAMQNPYNDNLVVNMLEG